MGLFRKTKIEKISTTHAELLSDKEILYNIVNSMDAKKNLTEEDFMRFSHIFNAIASRTEEYPADSMKYTDRCFSIAYDFEDEGVPYSKICGTATEVSDMFYQRCPSYNAAIEELVKPFIGFVEDVVKRNNLDEFKVFSLSTSFLKNIFGMIQAYYKMGCLTEFIPSIFMNSTSAYSRFVVSQFVDDKEGYEAFLKYQEQMDDAVSDKMLEVSLKAAIPAYSKRFIKEIGAENDWKCKTEMENLVDEWMALPEKLS